MQQQWRQTRFVQLKRFRHLIYFYNAQVRLLLTFDKFFVKSFLVWNIYCTFLYQWSILLENMVFKGSFSENTQKIYLVTVLLAMLQAARLQLKWKYVSVGEFKWKFAGEHYCQSQLFKVIEKGTSSQTLMSSKIFQNSPFLVPV